MREGDTVLLEKKKENKLSRSYEKVPCLRGDVSLRGPGGIAIATGSSVQAKPPAYIY